MFFEQIPHSLLTGFFIQDRFRIRVNLCLKMTLYAVIVQRQCSAIPLAKLTIAIWDGG
jgi:hypothetical protein